MRMLVKQIFVGKPRQLGTKGAAAPMDREWTSAIYKEAVAGPVWLGKTNLVGDGQADLENHGGPEKAIFVYPTEHYIEWQKELGDVPIGIGGMGENFAIEGFTEEMVCIGDIFAVGDAIVQVSQPRQPCWKPARRYRIKTLALLIQSTGRTGWYLRVLKEGLVEAGQTLTLLERPLPQWTVAKCNDVMHGEQPNFADMQELANSDLLAPRWKESLQRRVANRVVTPDISKRVIGPNE